ncbi:MAG TPA: hypothetical protein VMB73_31295 [Acetobacteraceae bacterium]|nr:hypothetical protein [Acetobacteraceae bacterium]
MQQRFGDARDRLDQVFAVVQHQQQSPRLQVCHNVFSQQRRRQSRQIERCGNRWQHQIGIGQRRQIGQPHAIWIVIDQAPCDGKDQAGLADPPSPGERQQAIAGLKFNDLPQIGLSPDQLTDRGRQIGDRRRGWTRTDMRRRS